MLLKNAADLWIKVMLVHVIQLASEDVLQHELEYPDVAIKPKKGKKA